MFQSTKQIHTTERFSPVSNDERKYLYSSTPAIMRGYVSTEQEVKQALKAPK